jgi:hypothetical protein
MTTLTEKLPTMPLADLNSLLANARRIAETGAGKQQLSAAEIVPLIEAELLHRKPAPVPKAPRKRAAPKGKAAKAAAEDAEEADAEELGAE